MLISRLMLAVLLAQTVVLARAEPAAVVELQALEREAHRRAPPASQTRRLTSQTCDGQSKDLPDDQCAAWQAFYDGTAGDGWKDTQGAGGPICQGMRNDP